MYRVQKILFSLLLLNKKMRKNYIKTKYQYP